MSKSVHIPARPETVEIDPEKTAVVVVDMQNAFFEGGVFDLASSFIDSIGAEWDFSEARKTIDPILKINAAARRHGMPVIHVVMRYAPDLSDAGGPTSPNWYRESIRHYHEHPEWRDSLPIRGTWGGEIIKELEPEEGDIIVEKIRYGGFSNTNLDAVLRTCDVRHVVFTGIADECLCGGYSQRRVLSRVFPDPNLGCHLRIWSHRTCKRHLSLRLNRSTARLRQVAHSSSH